MKNRGDRDLSILAMLAIGFVALLFAIAVCSYVVNRKVESFGGSELNDGDVALESLRDAAPPVVAATPAPRPAFEPELRPLKFGPELRVTQCWTTEEHVAFDAARPGSVSSVVSALLVAPPFLFVVDDSGIYCYPPPSGDPRVVRVVEWPDGKKRLCNWFGDCRPIARESRIESKNSPLQKRRALRDF